MSGQIRVIYRLLATCALGVLMVQGAMAAAPPPHKMAMKEADRALLKELKALHQQEKASKSPEERRAIRAQMKVKRHQSLAAMKSLRADKQGGK